MSKHKHQHPSSNPKTGAGAAAPKRRSLPLALRWLLVITGIVAFYTILGFGVVPLAIEKVVMPRLNERLSGPASLTLARCNPFTFFLELRGAELRDDTGQPAAAFERLAVNFDPFDSLYEGGWRFSEVTVEKPIVRGRLSAERSLNFLRLWKPAPPDPNAKPAEPIKHLPRVVVEKLAIDDGTASFRDESLPEPFNKEWRGLSFRIDNLDTKPDNKNPHRLTASTADGATLEWAGDLCVKPIASSGRLVLTGLKLPVFMPYIKTVSEGVIASGTVSAEVTYEFAPLAQTRVVKATIVKASVADVKVTQADEEVLASRLLEVEALTLDMSSGREIVAQRLRSDGASLLLRREQDRNLAQLRLFPRAAQDAAESPTEAPPQPPTSGDSAVVPRVDPRSIIYPVEQLVTAMQQLSQDMLGEWALAVEKVEVTDANARYIDLSTPRPVDVLAHGVSLSAGPLRSADNFATRFESAGKLGDRGSFEVTGDIAPFDRRATLNVKVADIDIAKASPYIPEQSIGPLPASRLTQASLTLDGALAASLDQNQVFSATWDGMLMAQGVRIEDAAAGTALLTLDKLDVQGKTAATVLDQALRSFDWNGALSLAGAAVEAPLAGPVKAGVDAASFSGTADFAMNIKGTLEATGVRAEAPEILDMNVRLARAALTEAAYDPQAKLLTAGEAVLEGPDAKAALALLPPVQEKGAAESKAREKEPEKAGDDVPSGPARRLVPVLPVNARIAAVRISGGRVEVRDLSSGAPAPLLVEDIAFEGQSVATDGSSESQIKAEARIGESGRARITGKTNFFSDSPTADVQVALASIAAKQYDPYVGRFVGYLVETGRVGATVPLTLKDSKIKGRLDFTLDQFFLGDSVDSPEAPDVPVKLGLDLLRDFDKNVKASIPLSGDLNDPQFSIGGLIGKAIINLIVGAATAPFQLLGGLFGALEGQDISFVGFDPGTADVGMEELSKLDVLARAMAERPAFKLKLAGRTSEKEDAPALKHAILREQMLERRRKESRTASLLTDEEYLEKIQDSYKELLAKSGQRAPARKDLPALEAMEKALLAEIAVPTERLLELARARAEKVLAMLTEEMNVASDRVTVVDVAEIKKAHDGPAAVFEVH